MDRWVFVMSLAGGLIIMNYSRHNQRSVECVWSNYSIGLLKTHHCLAFWIFFFWWLASIIFVGDILNKWLQIHSTCRGKNVTDNISVDQARRTSMCHDEMSDYYGNRYIAWNRGGMPASRRYSWKVTQETLSLDVRLTLETSASLSLRVVQYCDIMTIMILCDRHHKVSPKP